MGEENKREVGKAPAYHPRREELDYYEVDLRDYLRVLWKGKWIVLITFLAAVGAALGISYNLPKRYQTEIGLLILPPSAGEVGGEIAGTVFSAQTYESLALANDLLEAVIEEVYPQGERPPVEEVKRGIKVEVKQATAKGSPGFLAFHVKATFTGTEPKRLKELAEAWAQEFSARVGKLLKDMAARAFDHIKQSFEQVDKELRAREEERASYEKEHPLEVLQAEVDSLKTIYANYLSQLAEKKRALEEVKARLEALKGSLSREPQYFLLERGVSREGLEAFLSQRLSPKELEALPELKVKDQVLNGAYVSLRTQVAQAEAEVVSLEKGISFLESELERISGLIQKKQNELIDVEVELARMDREIEVLTGSYKSLATKLQEARLAQAETSEPIRVTEAPVIPRRPIGPNKKMNAAVAGVLGLFLGILLAFFVHYVREEPPSGAPHQGDPESSTDVTP